MRTIHLVCDVCGSSKGVQFVYFKRIGIDFHSDKFEDLCGECRDSLKEAIAEHLATLNRKAME